MVDTERLFNRIRDMAEEEFSLPKELFREDTVLRDAPLSFDDLMMVELMFTVEEEFANCNLDIDDRKFLACKTFGDVTRLVQTYMDGKERELETDYKEQDESIAAYEQDKELGTWLADDFTRRHDERKPTRKPPRAPRTPRTARSADVCERERKPRKAATEEFAIRKLNKAQKATASDKKNVKGTETETKERHGRYRRRKENGNSEIGEGKV